MISVVLPAYSEELAIGRTLEELRGLLAGAALPPCAFIVVDAVASVPGAIPAAIVAVLAALVIFSLGLSADLLRQVAVR